MKKILTIMSVCSIMIFLTPAWANQWPRGLASDHRIKIVPYRSDDVVTIQGSHLVVTTIQFNPREHILSIVNGDTVAWVTDVNKTTPNLLSIKPILPSSDTNMMVVTDKRTYQFHLMMGIGKGQATYFVRFRYSDEEQAELQQNVQQLQQTLGINAQQTPLKWNTNYSFAGSKYLAPRQAIDNGTLTVFRFAKQAMPAIFIVDAHRNERLANVRVQGDYVFIQGVHHQYTLRDGDEVAVVFNDAA